MPVPVRIATRTSSRSLMVSKTQISSSRVRRFWALTGGAVEGDGGDAVGDVEAELFEVHGGVLRMVVHHLADLLRASNSGAYCFPFVPAKAGTQRERA